MENPSRRQANAERGVKYASAIVTALGACFIGHAARTTVYDELRRNPEASVINTALDDGETRFGLVALAAGAGVFLRRRRFAGSLVDFVDDHREPDDSFVFDYVVQAPGELPEAPLIKEDDQGVYIITNVPELPPEPPKDA